MPKRRLAIAEDQEDGSQPLVNKRHEAFCLAYVGECRDNAAAAYRAAGYKDAKNAHVNGCQLLTKTNIKRRVKYLEDELAEQEKLKAIDAIRHLKAIATVTITDFMKPDGTLDEAKLQDRNLTQAIQELTPTFDKDGVRIGWKLKLKDSMRALELLGLTEREEVVHNNQVLVIKV